MRLRNSVRQVSELQLMENATPQPPLTRLRSHYSTWRDPDGRLVIRAASARGPVLGCLIPTALVVALGSLVALVGGFPLMFGPPVVALIFAVIAIPILFRQGTRAWVLGPRSIQPATAVGRRQWRAPSPRAAQSVVLKREVWRGKRRGAGSTDTVSVVTDRDSRIAVLSVYNWAGQESRLASAGAGSLARAAPSVPPAPKPLAATADATLMASVSDAVSELADILVSELGVAIKYECAETLVRPR